MRYFFSPGKRGEGASRTSGIRKSRRTFQRRCGEYNAICNSSRCNADLPRRTDAGRPTRIIAKSDAYCTCAILDALYTRATFIEHYLFLSISFWKSRDVVPSRASVTIERASRLREAKLSVTGCPRSRALPSRVPWQVHDRKSRENLSRLLSLFF